MEHRFFLLLFLQCWKRIQQMSAPIQFLLFGLTLSTIASNSSFCFRFFWELVSLNRNLQIKVLETLERAGLAGRVDREESIGCLRELSYLSELPILATSFYWLGIIIEFSRSTNQSHLSLNQKYLLPSHRRILTSQKLLQFESKQITKPRLLLDSLSAPLSLLTLKTESESLISDWINDMHGWWFSWLLPSPLLPLAFSSVLAFLSSIPSDHSNLQKCQWYLDWDPSTTSFLQRLFSLLSRPWRRRRWLNLERSADYGRSWRMRIGHSGG